MKLEITKFTITLFLMFIMNIGLAQQVTQSEAKNAAANIMRYETRNDLYVNSISAVYEKNVNDNTLLYEVVFDDGHIVLLSGNKSCIPVLGMIIPDEDVYPSSILEGYNDYVINSGAHIHLSAGKDIILTDGFLAVEGSDFYAEITSTNSSRGGGKNNSYNEISQNYNETVEYGKLTIPSNTFNTPLDINIYPNTTDNVFNISFNNQDEFIKQITVVDHLGSVVINKENPNDNTFNMNNLSSGLYLVKIISNTGNVYFEKVVRK